MIKKNSKTLQKFSNFFLVLQKKKKTNTHTLNMEKNETPLPEK